MFWNCLLWTPKISFSHERSGMMCRTPPGLYVNIICCSNYSLGKSAGGWNTSGRYEVIPEGQHHHHLFNICHHHVQLTPKTHDQNKRIQITMGWTLYCTLSYTLYHLVFTLTRLTFFSFRPDEERDSDR